MIWMNNFTKADFWGFLKLPAFNSKYPSLIRLTFQSPKLMLSFKLCCALKNYSNLSDHFSVGKWESKFKAETMNLLRGQFNTLQLCLSSQSYLLKNSRICENIYFICQTSSPCSLSLTLINIMSSSSKKTIL